MFHLLFFINYIYATVYFQANNNYRNSIIIIFLTNKTNSKIAIILKLILNEFF